MSKKCYIKRKNSSYITVKKSGFFKRRVLFLKRTNECAIRVNSIGTKKVKIRAAWLASSRKNLFFDRIKLISKNINENEDFASRTQEMSNNTIALTISKKRINPTMSSGDPLRELIEEIMNPTPTPETDSKE